MALDFPTSPALNQTYTFGSYTWRWDGTSWVGAVPIVNATINNTTIGAVTPSTGAFTTLSATTPIAGASGGTGVNNGANTITIAGNVTHAGAFTQTFTATANTSLTLPVTGTLATLAGSEALSNKTITASAFNGTVGATTPSTGKFTTLQSSSTIVSKISSGVLTYKDSVSPSVGLAEYYRINDGATLSGLIGTRDQVFGGTISDFAIDARSGNLVLGCGGSIVGTFTSTGLNSTAIGATTRSTVAATTISTTGTVTATADNIKAFVGTTGAGTGFAYGTYETNGGAQYGRVGIEGSVGGNLMIGTSAYDFIVGGISGNTWIGAGGTGIAKVSGTGLVVTGALSANTLFVHQTTAATEAIATIRTAANSAGSRASPLYSSLNFRGYDGVGGAGSLKGSIRVGDMTVDTNAGILTFSTLNQSNTFGERARFGETGNFLIGTTTDIAGTGNLVVAGVVSSTGKITSGGNIQVAAAGDLTWGGNYGAGIPVINGTSGVGFTFYPNGSTSGAVAVLNSTGLAVTGALSSTTGANFATSSGSVGIGTASPSAKLHVSAAGFGAGNALFQSTNSANYITIRGVNGTGINDSAFILFEDGTSSRDAFIGLTGDAATAGYLRFATNGNTERMRLNSTGLTVVSLGTGLVYSNNGLLTSTNPSDARLKTDITDLGYGLSSILALRPVSYKWKSDTVNQGTQYGFIAQEVQTVMPDLVKEFETTEDGEKVTRLGLEKEGIYAALVKAVQELNGLNANLVAELQSVRQRLAALENS